jgi:hypothetical protein
MSIMLNLNLNFILCGIIFLIILSILIFTPNYYKLFAIIPAFIFGVLIFKFQKIQKQPSVIQGGKYKRYIKNKKNKDTLWDIYEK